MSVEHRTKLSGDYSLSFRLVSSVENEILAKQQVTDYALILAVALILWGVFGLYAVTPCVLELMRTYFQTANE